MNEQRLKRPSSQFCRCVWKRIRKAATSVARAVYLGKSKRHPRPNAHLEQSKSVQQTIQEADFNFLVEILQAAESSKADPQVVYPLLQQHLAKLDDRFAKVLQVWAEFTLPEVGLEERRGIARGIGYFSRLMYEFPLGNRATNMEIAIIGNKIALSVYTRNTSPEFWAGFQHNLGNIYAERIYGERVDNLEQAIAYYQQALEECPRSRSPVNCRANSL